MVGYANLFLYIYDVKEIKVMKKILYLHGLESSNIGDSVVDPIKTVNILKHLDFYCDIEKMNGLGHRIPLNVFIDIYDKYIK